MAYTKRLAALLAVASIVVGACGSSTSPSASVPAGTAAPQATTPSEATPAPTAAAPESYPRTETLYTTGKQWGPPSTWNPLDPNAATGTVGLQYETLFLYDPFTDTFEPWLAESATWTDPTTYTIKTRQGATWSDGPRSRPRTWLSRSDWQDHGRG